MKIDASFVKAERTRRGWTQEQLAEVAALSIRTVQRVERMGVASNESVSALCAVLGVDRARLLEVPAPSAPASAAKRTVDMETLVAGILGGVVSGVVSAVVAFALLS